MTLVKICGITNLRDALLATEYGADFLGFVFYPKSPRGVTHDQVRDIVQQLGQCPDRPTPRLVGVFVDQKQEVVSHTLKYCGLGYAQLHGSEPPEMARALMEQGSRVIKAFRVRDQTYLEELMRYRSTAFLLDTYAKGQPGGTGQTFNWSLAVAAKERGRVILAGGLTPENVTAAITAVQPWAVDVSSGVEEKPGRKDPGKLLRLIRTAKRV